MLKRSLWIKLASKETSCPNRGRNPNFHLKEATSPNERCMQEVKGTIEGCMQEINCAVEGCKKEVKGAIEENQKEAFGAIEANLFFFNFVKKIKFICFALSIVSFLT